MLVLRSLLFAIAFYAATIMAVLLSIPFAFVGGQPLYRMVEGWGMAHRWLCRLILGQKVEVIGDLPQLPALYIFKHESMFETIDMLCLFRAPVIAAKQELLDIPGWGWLAGRYGLIGLQRESGAKALRHLKKHALATIAEGRPLILFPEGTRVPHGEHAPLRAGFAALYKILGLPVVPVAVDSGRLSPRNSFIKRPGTIYYKVGEIVPPGLDRAEAENRVLAAINALNPPVPAAPGTGDGHSAPA